MAYYWFSLGPLLGLQIKFDIVVKVFGFLKIHLTMFLVDGDDDDDDKKARFSTEIPVWAGEYGFFFQAWRKLFIFAPLKYRTELSIEVILKTSFTKIKSQISA